MRRILPISRINDSIAVNWDLDGDQVETRRIKYGVNDITERHKNRSLELLIDTIKDPMIWFLIVTSTLFFILQNYNQGIILLLATIPLIGMDAFLHWRTQLSTKNLKHSLATTAVVIRSGIEMKIQAWEIVPGDLMVISTGDYFSADGIIIDGTNMQADESILTGEAFPVSKQIFTQLPRGNIDFAIESHYWGFAGTRLLTGRALLRVVYTGAQTWYGEIIASALSTTQARTHLQKAIAKLVFILIVTAVILCLILATVRYYQGFGLMDALLSAALLAIAALPDEFPVVFTFFLGVGVYRLARKMALVKRAVSVENIGRVTCICSDKTGTITEGRFKLTQYYPSPEFDDSKLLLLASVASRLESGDPLDTAIFEAVNGKQSTSGNRITTFPFTEERKRETSIAEFNAHQYLVATKGAPESILLIAKISTQERQTWNTHIHALASQGYKLIGVAQLLIDKSDPLLEPQSGYQFAGLLAFTDPPRKEVAQAVKSCQEAQIHVLMITGDHPETAAAVAHTIGLGYGNPKIILAQDIPHLSLSRNFLRTIDVIARAIPSQKLEIVKALQAEQEIVAVTGDGINDVPALKAADIGIAMGERGTQSAREAADMVLLDDNFGSIVNAIAEGKQLFKNLKKSFQYLLMIHLPFILSAAIIPLLGFPLLYYPIHIVWIELLIHPTSMLVFQDLPLSNKLSPAKRRSQIYFFTPLDWLSIIIIGILTTTVVIFSFTFILKTTHHVEHARGLALANLAITSAALTIGLSNLRSMASQIITLCTILFSVALIQIPILSALLFLNPLSFKEWILVTLNGLVVIGLLQVINGRQYSRN